MAEKLDTVFDPSVIKSKWLHPLLAEAGQKRVISKSDLHSFAHDYFLRFLPFFRKQAEGSLPPGTTISISKRMKQKLGLAYLFENKISLNENHFSKEPQLLPYTLFHEMTHLWLYSSLLDPGHTLRFYDKMVEFNVTGLPVDPEVYIHKRISKAGTHVYFCPNCRNRWYHRRRLQHSIYCGHCHDNTGKKYFAEPLDIVDAPASTSEGKSSPTVVALTP